MIPDIARYHGSFFILLFEHLNEEVSVRKLPVFGTGYYLISESVPVYLKMSARRSGPWTFNFFRSHQQTQQDLFTQFGECFTCLICGKDGIAGLSMRELRDVLDDNFEEQECISVRRKLKTMYQIKGRDGALEHRLSRRSIFDKLSIAIKKEKDT
jgi:hypothetical protein